MPEKSTSSDEASKHKIQMPHHKCGKIREFQFENIAKEKFGASQGSFSGEFEISNERVDRFDSAEGEFELSSNEEKVSHKEGDVIKLGITSLNLKDSNDPGDK